MTHEYFFKCFKYYLGGHLKTAQHLAAHEGWSACHARCQQDSTAVMWAATGGHKEILQWLILEQECDVNLQNKVGRTALMFAAKYGHSHCLRWMVEKCKADIQIRALDDSDVFAWAVFGADVETLETVASLLAPAELHRKNKFGCTAIHWAATGGNVQVLKWLYARGKKRNFYFHLLLFVDYY